MLEDVKQEASQRILKEAGETISAKKVVYIEGNKAYIASSDNVACVDRVIGLSVASASLGSNVLIQPFGEMENSSWSWDDEKLLFLGLNGDLTQTPPAGGFNCIIGSAIDSNRIFININDSVELV